MKIAFLITAYDNPDHLYRLVETLRKNKNFGIYIHIDKKCKYIFKEFGNDIYIEKNPLNVYWGDYSFIDAVTKLLMAALKKNYNRYFLISGSDYPLVSNEYIEKFFTNNSFEYINVFKMPENNKSLDRVFYYKFQNTNFFWRIVNFLIRTLRIKRPYPTKYRDFLLYGGSTWWSLTDNCIKYILNFIKNNTNLNSFYRNTYIPEEMYFHTIVGNSIFKDKARRILVYTDWEMGAAHPVLLTLEHFKKKSKFTNEEGSPYLFARKFPKNSDEIIKFIDKRMRHGK